MPADFKQGTNLAGQTLACATIGVTTEVPLYTVPASSAAKVASAWLHNSTTTSVSSIAIYKTPSGGTKTRIAYVTNLAGGDSAPLPQLVGAFIEAGCVISAIASTASAVAFDLTGVVSS
jgi:hypothetical protein